MAEFYSAPDASYPECPHCGAPGAELWRDSANVGVGIIYGPWGCPQCGWSESEEYDQTRGVNRRPDARGGYKDQFGGYHPPGSSRARVYRAADAAVDDEARRFVEG